MTEKIKFIVDDLANYSGDLLDYSSHILYLPKRIEVDAKSLNFHSFETQSSYSEEFLDAVHNNRTKMGAASMGLERYEEILEGFLSDYPDYDFIYVKPWIPGETFASDLSDLESVIEQINILYNSKIRIFYSNSFGSALHYIIYNLISQYVNNDKTISDLENLFIDLNSNTYEYVSLYDKSLVKRHKWENFEDLEAYNRVLFKFQNRNKTYFGFNGEPFDFYKFCVKIISEELNSLKKEYDFVVSLFPKSDEYDINESIALFLQSVENHDTYSLHYTSQSNFIINSDGESFSICVKS